MILKDYQEIAIKKLVSETKSLIERSGQKTLIFKAPTGSGKTIMMAEFLKRLSDDKSHTPLSFIWTAPQKLHEQSKEKLENYFEDSMALPCSFFEDLDDKQIAENEVLFFNWESITRADNIYIRDNEQDLNLSNVILNTRNEQRKIILIIDESHYSARGEQAQQLRNDIAADLTIEVSATPELEAPDSYISVDIEDVKDEAMIKKAVILNDGFKNFLEKGKIKTELGNDSEELVIKVALNKRDELVKAYQKEGRKINPLILVQLPNRRTEAEDRIKQNVINILKKNKITTDNFKLAIHLSENKENLEEITDNENETEVLIFKQALALGWDCPRAQIIALFREWHDPVFSLQTVGRIMRMPEPDNGKYYKNENLNYAYVFTNLSDIDIVDDIAKDYITIYTSKRKDIYKEINLLSYSQQRHRERTRLAPLFIKKFLEVADRNNLSKKINKKARKLNQKTLTDWYTENINLAHAGIVEEGGTVTFGMTSNDLQRYFDFFVRRNLHKFYPEDRTVARVKEAIYRFFDNRLEMQYDFIHDEIIQVVLSNENLELIKNTINEAELEYFNEVSNREKVFIPINEWNIPESLRYNEKYHSENFNKSIMKPVFAKSWRTEKKFSEYLDTNTRNIEWWFKNGERDAVSFAVPYEFEDDNKLFFVDYVVKMKDGSIGLFDTKTGITLRDAKAKSDGLQKYIKQNKSKKLFGGIVTNTDQNNLTGSWKYYDGKGKNMMTTDLSKWKNVEL